MKQWLKDAVFYEIYPQSFYDTNGDGIGDIPGITAKLDYIRELGCNALWINPCFDSPFKDAGYDVRDYKKVAPRYGTNDDLIALFQTAHQKGIRVLLDLVPGHTSEEHAWFQESCKPEPNEYSQRYIWTDSCFSAADGMPFIGGETPRNGTYVLNFFKCQPALNYGYGKCNYPWQKPTDDPDCVATVEAIKDVMRFWLDAGCDGFRVDMASSLVKNDTRHKKYTCAIWRDIAAMLRAEYPEAALVSEWNDPRRSLKNGFDMDFMLEWQGNGYSWLMRNYEGATDSNPHNIGKAYFCADSDTDIHKFLDDWLPAYKDTRKDGLYCLITCNHDTIRPSAGLTVPELKLAYAMLFTMPGAPFLYYGDEIGMRYLPLPTKEGGYFRTGSRTPMQWDGTANLGFSTAPADKLYLPVDPAADAPTVAAQQEDPDSLLNTVRALLAFRHAYEDLDSDAPFEVLYAPKAKSGQRPFAYRRGDLICAVNPALDEAVLPLELSGGIQPLFSLGGGGIRDGELVLEGQSFVILG
ncbi:MAG: alpha-amylase family glycosyl hydrolase [Gemmiger sp.]